MKKYFTKEVQIALAVIVSAIILVVGIDYLKGINIFKPANYYYVNYKNVTGLTVSSPVLVDGFKVGLVRSLEYNYKDGFIVVEIDVDRNLKVPQGSKAILNIDMLGTASIDLQLNKLVGATHQIGDQLIGENSADLMSNIEDNVMPQLILMLPKLDSILYYVQTVVSDPALKNSLKRMDHITAQLEISSVQLSAILNKDLPGVLHNVSDITGDVKGFTSQLKDIELTKTVNLVDSTLYSVREITQKLSNPDNSLGLLLNDKSLYNGLVETVNNADSLMIDLKKNPKRYVHFSVFGKK